MITTVAIIRELCLPGIMVTILSVVMIQASLFNYRAFMSSYCSCQGKTSSSQGCRMLSSGRTGHWSPPGMNLMLLMIIVMISCFCPPKNVFVPASPGWPTGSCGASGWCFPGCWCGFVYKHLVCYCCIFSNHIPLTKWYVRCHTILIIRRSSVVRDIYRQCYHLTYDDAPPPTRCPTLILSRQTH